METGLIIDYTHGASTQTEWMEGEPKHSFWTGLQIRGRARHAVVTYRCTRCGFLESYAPSNTPQER
jgi:hypothetical protein